MAYECETIAEVCNSFDWLNCPHFEPDMQLKFAVVFSLTGERGAGIAGVGLELVQ